MGVFSKGDVVLIGPQAGTKAGMAGWFHRLNAPDRNVSGQHAVEATYQVCRQVKHYIEMQEILLRMHPGIGSAAT